MLFNFRCLAMIWKILWILFKKLEFLFLLGFMLGELFVELLFYFEAKELVNDLLDLFGVGLVDLLLFGFYLIVLFL